MSVRALVVALVVLAAPVAASTGPSLTLYTSDLGLVKESRALDKLKRAQQRLSAVRE